LFFAKHTQYGCGECKNGAKKHVKGKEKKKVVEIPEAKKKEYQSKRKKTLDQHRLGIRMRVKSHDLCKRETDTHEENNKPHRFRPLKP